MADEDRDQQLQYCALPRRPAPVIPQGMDFDRANAIVVGRQSGRSAIMYW